MRGLLQSVVQVVCSGQRLLPALGVGVGIGPANPFFYDPGLRRAFRLVSEILGGPTILLIERQIGRSLLLDKHDRENLQ